MNVADWAIVGVILLSVLLAASQGFFFEVISLAGLVVGYLLAAWQYPRVAEWFAPHVKSPWVAEILGFVIIFVAVIILAGVLGRIIRWAVKEAGLRWADRLLGGAFGLLRGSLMVSIFLLSLTTFAPQSRWLQESELAPYFLVVARGASWLAPFDVRARFRQGLDSLEKMRHGQEAPAPAATPARQ
jgi:membrane protein required for colicin V production